MTGQQEHDEKAMAEAYLQQASLALTDSASEALKLSELAENLFRRVGDALKATQARLISSKASLAQGQWGQAKHRLDGCKILLAPLEKDHKIDPAFRLLLLQLEAEIVYVGCQQGHNNLNDLYEALLNLAEELEKARRLRPGQFDTIWLFGQLDVYERLVAVAYQLGLITQAFNWAERTKARRLLDLLLNLPFEYNENE